LILHVRLGFLRHGSRWHQTQNAYRYKWATNPHDFLRLVCFAAPS
jgi:hypothetical protein